MHLFMLRLSYGRLLKVSGSFRANILTQDGRKLRRDGVVVALHVGDVKKLRFNMLELALVMREDSQQATQFQPPRRVARVRFRQPQPVKRQKKKNNTYFSHSTIHAWVVFLPGICVQKHPK